MNNNREPLALELRAVDLVGSGQLKEKLTRKPTAQNSPGIALLAPNIGYTRVFSAQMYVMRQSAKQTSFIGMKTGSNWKTSWATVCLSTIIALGSSLSAQKPDGTPTRSLFSFTIAPKEVAVKSGQLAWLVVKEKNTSGKVIDLSKVAANDDSHWYLIDIHRNGGRSKRRRKCGGARPHRPDR